MTVRSRLKKLEARQSKKDGYLILAGPEDATEEAIDEAVATWTRETGKPKPGLTFYLRRFNDPDKTIRVL